MNNKIEWKLLKKGLFGQFFIDLWWKICYPYGKVTCNCSGTSARGKNNRDRYTIITEDDKEGIGTWFKGGVDPVIDKEGGGYAVLISIDKDNNIKIKDLKKL